MALALALAGCASTGGGRAEVPGRVSSRRPARPQVRLASADGGMVPGAGMEGLARAFARGQYDIVERAFDEVWSPGRDDFALALLEAISDEALSRAVRAPEGRRLLRGFYIELTSNWVSEGENKQAHRILVHHAQRVGVDAFVKAMLSAGTKVFPYQSSGASVLHSAAFIAWLEEDGSITVHLEASAYGGTFPEALRMPVSVIHVGEDEVVGVRRYDEGEKLEFGPALLLLRYSNETKRRTELKMTEMAALGLAAGAVGVPVRATLLVWCDRAAMAVGTLSMVVDEHRGWILERFGQDGETFLRYSDAVGSVAALYGVVRVVTAVPKLVTGLRDSWQALKARQAVLRGAEHESFAALDREMDALLRSFDDLSREGAAVIPIESARKPVPPVAQEPLRATGTGGPPVGVQRGATAEPTVASVRPGPPRTTEPLALAPPGYSRPTTVQPRGVPFRVSVTNAEEVQAIAAKFVESELAATGPRYSARPEQLHPFRPDPHRPPAGMSPERWQAYQAYWNRRYEALANGIPGTKAPLTPEAYNELATVFARGLEHERNVASILRADLARPPAERQLLPDMREPRVDSQVGVAKGGIEGTRYVDDLVVDMATVKSTKPSVEAFSCKSRTLKGQNIEEVKAIVQADVEEALSKYGRRLEVRRPDHSLFGRAVEVRKVHLVYEAKLVDLKLHAAITKAGASRGVEVHFQ